MKRFVLLLLLLFCGVAHAETINLHWLNDDGTLYQNSTCTVDGDLILPTPPTKYGYTFTGWKLQNYIPIEYLESTGTQWIDTGVKSSTYTQKIEARIKTSVLSYTTINNKNPFFMGASEKINNIDALIRLFLLDGYFAYSYQATSGMQVGSNIYTKVKPILNTIYDINIMYETNGVYLSIYSNGTELQTITTQANLFLPNKNIFLFGNNESSIDARPFIGRIYETKMLQNDTLVRDMIPVLDMNGTPCMYDKVEGIFYYNAGTGDFIAGPVISE